MSKLGNMGRKKSKFPGFPRDLEKSFWQFPTIINGYVHSLSGAEFKVLWYILRHTFGWQKNSDKLSLSQISKGIVKRDGKVVDRGTGLTRTTIYIAIQSLEEKGFITVKRKERRANEISPNIVGWVKNYPRGGLKINPGGGLKINPTINNIPINNTNTHDSANAHRGTDSSYKKNPCPNKQEGHRGCIEFIDSFAASRGVKFANYAKQINALHKLLRTGYTFDQINKQIDLMEKKQFWRMNGFDLMNVVNEIGKGGE